MKGETINTIETVAIALLVKSMLDEKVNLVEAIEKYQTIRSEVEKAMEEYCGKNGIEP